MFEELKLKKNILYKFIFLFCLFYLVSVDVSHATENNSKFSSSNFTYGYYLAGQFARYIGDQESAAKFYNIVLSKDSENRDLQYRTINLLVSAGKIYEAIKLAKSIKEYDFDYSQSLVLTLLCVDSVKAGNVSKAEEYLRQIPYKGLGELVRPVMAAWIFASKNDLSEVNAALDRLGRNGKFASFLQYHKALIQDYMNIEEARLSYLNLMQNKKTRTIRAIESYGSYLRRYGYADEAEQLFSKNLPKNSSSVIVQEARFFARKNPNLRVVNSAPQGIAEAFYAAAKALMQNNEYEIALLYSRLAVYLRPHSSISNILLGEALDRGEQWPDAIKAYSKIDKESPLGWRARLRIARNLQRLSRNDEAVSILSEMIKEKPKRIDSLVALGDIYRSEKQWLKAIKNYNFALKRINEFSSNHWSLFYYRGIAFERSKQWASAEPSFLKALELKPDQPLVMNYLAYSWVEQGVNLEKARIMIEKAVSLRPRDGYIVDSLGWVLFRLGDFNGAVKALERAILLQPDDPIINMHLGDAYWKVKRFREARFQWERALVFEPEIKDISLIKIRLKEGLKEI